MSEKTYCEKCGSEMKVINDNHPDGMTCPNCGWGWVTSYFEPILSDTCDYHIILLPCENSLLAIKTVSEIANCNYIDAKKMIEKAPIELFCGKAVKVKEFKNRFESENIKIKIEPDFPY